MSTDILHHDHAKNNIKFLKSFCPSHAYNDWTITVAFYSAVHLIEFAVAKEDSITFLGKKISINHSTDLPYAAHKNRIKAPKGYDFETKSAHKMRNMLLLGTDEFSGIAGWFLLLYKKSLAARYEQYLWKDLQVDLLISGAYNPLVSWLNNKYKTDFENIKKK